MRHSEGVAVEIVSRSESPSQAWGQLIQHCRAGCLTERIRVTIAFYVTKMEVGEHPRNFPLRVDRMVKGLERVSRPVDLKRLNSQFDAEVCMLERSSDQTTLEQIERAASNNSSNASRSKSRPLGRKL